MKPFRKLSIRLVSIFVVVSVIGLTPTLPISLQNAKTALAAGEPSFPFDNANYVNSNGLSISLQVAQSQGQTSLKTLTPALSRFTALNNGNAIAISSVSTSGIYLSLGLATRVYKNDVLTISYSNTAGLGIEIENLANIKALSFGPTVISTHLPSVQTVPNSPGVSTVVAGQESATITVVAPTSGPAPTSYIVTASPDGKTCTVTGASGACTITGLTAGTAYTFTTVAKTAQGSSPAGTASSSITVLAKSAPNTPGVPTVVAGEESATITVVAPTSGVTPTSYEVTASPGGAKCTVTGALGSCTITGLTAGTAYTFTTIAKVSTGDSTASTASASVTALTKTVTTTTVPVSTTVPTVTTTIPAGYTPSWDREPLTDSETDANTVGFFPAVSPGVIIITDEMGFTLDKKNGIKPKIRMKSYAGKIKMTISATYKVGAKSKKYKCTFAPFGTVKKFKTAKWRWYTPKKACILPAPLVTAVRANTATLSASGKWTRQWLTTSKKARPDKTKIKPRTLKYTMRAKPTAVK